MMQMVDGRARTGRAHHGPTLPLRVGTRASPLALYQTRHFLDLIRAVCPLLKQVEAFEEHQISTEGDRVQDRRLAEIGGKGLFAKEIHEALLDGRVDFAVHSLKDLETELPPGVALACTLRREDPRDALVLGAACHRHAFQARARAAAFSAPPTRPAATPMPRCRMALSSARLRCAARASCCMPAPTSAARSSAAMCRRASAGWPAASSMPRCSPSRASSAWNWSPRPASSFPPT
jgi:hypothetical protein